MISRKTVEQFTDQIVLVDLENGMQLTTRIKSVTDNNEIVCEDLVMFQIANSLPDPSRPPGPTNQPEQRIQAQHCGGPFRHPKSPIPTIDMARVLFIHKPIDAIEKAYMQATTGIEVASAGSIQGIRG